MGERHEMLGQRAELMPQRQRLRVECEALRDKLRAALPVHEDVDALNGETILTAAIALQTSLAELAGMNRKIEILNRELGS
ncbi:MAG: hypothetical protein LBJ14_10480 [Desulfarculales bacterium]|jgi:hypothetical protein|nr:hypothetical protein [Desulfarculales bacterium]